MATTKLSQQVIEVIETGLIHGSTVKDSCCAAGVNVSTYYGWMRRGADPQQAYPLYVDLRDRVLTAKAIALLTRRSPAKRNDPVRVSPPQQTPTNHFDDPTNPSDPCDGLEPQRQRGDVTSQDRHMPPVPIVAPENSGRPEPNNHPRPSFMHFLTLLAMVVIAIPLAIGSMLIRSSQSLLPGLFAWFSLGKTGMALGTKTGLRWLNHLLARPRLEIDPRGTIQIRRRE